MRTNNEHNRFSLRIAISASLLYYSAVISFNPIRFLYDPDMFWHIRTGEWILDNTKFPTVDFFSYTAAGNPWISTEWLSQIFFAVAYRYGGWHAVVILAAVACATVVGILCFYMVRHVRFSIAVGWTALTSAAISQHFLARPHIFSFVLLAIWIINLIDAYDKNNFNLRSWFTLTPLMVLWANLHGSFTFGLLLLYVFCGVCIVQNIMRNNYAKCRFLLIGVFVVSLGALMTPYGISSTLMTKEVLNLKSAFVHVPELQSPNFQTQPFQLSLLIGLLVSIAGLGIQLRGARLLTFAIIAFIGFSYARGLVMFFLLAPIILARSVSARASYFTPQLLDAVHPNKEADPILRYLQRWSNAVPTVCLAIAALATVSSYWQNVIVPPKSIAPEDAINFVNRTHITGNVFNSYNFGGYLIFSGIPTFVDGRALPFGDDFLRKYSNAVNLVDINSAFQMLDDYRISWIILQPSEPLSKAIARSASWDKAYSDQYSIVFVRHQQ